MQTIHVSVRTELDVSYECIPFNCELFVLFYTASNLRICVPEGVYFIKHDFTELFAQCFAVSNLRIYVRCIEKQRRKALFAHVVLSKWKRFSNLLEIA